ncbi:Rrf2 family transcriptional regulator [Paenibacillus athensensis]|uniref:Transcriptional regulator n=1 Tax=Paenibacillus athensensis TaxID=1967502 RepID=A0A4Y8Q736_9BACL|nr:Rrf2 family transcriptional regulator [Paenibacillus athensensis]MCD1257435.1 Rrf2 family transcriptional regulator [Paenibacillus athensensis]
MKQISSKFSIAVHILSLIAVTSSQLCTGDYMAGSINTNPVIVRRIMANLKKAGLIAVRPGVGGATLMKDIREITLLDIYRAVEVAEAGGLFHIHGEPNMNCPVGRNIEGALRSELQEAQRALEQRLQQVTLQELVAKFT